VNTAIFKKPFCLVFQKISLILTILIDEYTSSFVAFEIKVTATKEEKFKP
jgi:hypothetical protein